MGLALQVNADGSSCAGGGLDGNGMPQLIQDPAAEILKDVLDYEEMPVAC